MAQLRLANSITTTESIELYTIYVGSMSGVTYLDNLPRVIIIITLLSNRRVEIHFALRKLHKNTIFKSHSNACIQ